MKKKNLSFISCYLILVLLLVGCTSKSIASDDSENDIGVLKSEVLELNQHREKQQLLFEEQEKRIMLNETKLKELEEAFAVLHNNFHAMNQLIHSTLESKTAMLNHAEIKGDKLNLNITSTEKISDLDSPNGYRLEETEEGTIDVSVSKNTPIYLLDNATSIIQVDWNKVVSHRGLLQLYEKNGEVVFIAEIYLP